MNKKEQLSLLMDILAEASKYEATEQDTVRLEVMNRIQSLINDMDVVVVETEKKPKVRITIDGKKRTVLAEDCIQVKHNSPTGYAWKYMGAGYGEEQRRKTESVQGTTEDEEV